MTAFHEIIPCSLLSRPGAQQLPAPGRGRHGGASQNPDQARGGGLVAGGTRGQGRGLRKVSRQIVSSASRAVIIAPVFLFITKCYDSYRMNLQQRWCGVCDGI